MNKPRTINCSKQAVSIQGKPIFRFNKLALTLLMVGWMAQSHAANTYSLTELGIIPTAINKNGLIIGSNYYLYNPANASLTNIQTLTGGAALTSVYDINNFGQVAGVANNHAYARDTSGLGFDIGVLPGDATSVAYAYNDLGQVVGFSAPSSATPCAVHGFLGTFNASGIQLKDLGSLGGARNYAFDINASGQAVGKSSYNLATDCLITGGYHAYVTTPTGLSDLHSVNMLGNQSTAYKINDQGMVVGDFANGLLTTATGLYYPNGYPIRHAVRWNSLDKSYNDLGNGSNDSSLLSVNNKGEMVGIERTFSTAYFSGSMPIVSNQYAVIAFPGSGLINLNSLVVNMPAGWSLRTAVDINDAGQIIGSARDSLGYTRGVLLTPFLTPVDPLPAAPSGLKATATTASQISLSWTDNATNETGQTLERCQGVGCSIFSMIATLNAGVTSYSNANLSPSTSYSYRIKANGANGSSAYSNVLTTATLTPVDPATLLPAAPSNLSSVAISKSSISLNWKDNATNEQNYLIERCKGQYCTTFSVIASKGANTVSFTNSSLNSRTNFRYRVRALNAKGYSSYSNITTVSTL